MSEKNGKNETVNEAPSVVYNPFQAETQTVHAEWWPDGWTVTIKELTYADTQRLATAGFKITQKLPTTKKAAKLAAESLTYSDMDLERLKCQTMLAAIVSWTLPNGDGTVMPLTEASIKKLRARDGEFIEEAIGAINPDRSEEFPD